jgi:biotin-(acetyl-CoA carboxylase) ligase
MASQGAPEGTVLQWTTDKSVLSFSAILRPSGERPPGLLAVIATFSASEGIRKDTGIISFLRWPDEVVAGGAVLASTSLETGGTSDSRWAVLSFLVNRAGVRRVGSTSLQALLGASVDSDMLVSKVLDSLSWMHSGWTKGMYPQILPRIGSMLDNGGASVNLLRGGGAVSGVVIGVDEKGRLLVELGGSRGTARVESRSMLGFR